MDLKKCDIATCEYWSNGTQCHKCESECKNFSFSICRLFNVKCFEIDNCYYKQAKRLKDCLLDIYNYKMSRRDINKHIEKCFSEMQELQKLVKKKLRVVK